MHLSSRGIWLINNYICLPKAQGHTYQSNLSAHVTTNFHCYNTNRLNATTNVTLIVFGYKIKLLVYYRQVLVYKTQFITVSALKLSNS